MQPQETDIPVLPIASDHPAASKHRVKHQQACRSARYLLLVDKQDDLKGFQFVTGSKYTIIYVRFSLCDRDKTSSREINFAKASFTRKAWEMRIMQ
jgi:hypothetical protein